MDSQYLLKKERVQILSMLMATSKFFSNILTVRYVDFCLGDTGAMTGHSPDKVVKAVTEQIKKGWIILNVTNVKELLSCFQAKIPFGLGKN